MRLLLGADLSLLEVAGILTHLAVFMIGVFGIAGIVPLPRGRRSGLGLVLMALVMTLLVVKPGGLLGALAAAGYTIGFAGALWLLIGPVRSVDAGNHE